MKLLQLIDKTIILVESMNEHWALQHHKIISCKNDCKDDPSITYLTLLFIDSGAGLLKDGVAFLLVWCLTFLLIAWTALWLCDSVIHSATLLAWACSALLFIDTCALFLSHCVALLLILDHVLCLTFLFHLSDTHNKNHGSRSNC